MLQLPENLNGIQLLEYMQNQAKEQAKQKTPEGTPRNRTFWVPKGKSNRVRFLVPFADAGQVQGHTRWGEYIPGKPSDSDINVVCGRDYFHTDAPGACPWCDEIEAGNPRKVQTHSLFYWPVYVYNENPELKVSGFLRVLCGPLSMNASSPVKATMGFYEILIKDALRTGQQPLDINGMDLTYNNDEQKTSYSLMPSLPSPFTVEVEVPGKVTLLRWIVEAKNPAYLTRPFEEAVQEEAPSPLLAGIEAETTLYFDHTEEKEEEVDAELEAMFAKLTPAKKAQIQRGLAEKKTA